MFDELRALYSDEIRRHGRKPAHTGKLEGAMTAKGDNPMCGDRVQVFVVSDADNISRTSFEARGCEISIASADLMCEAVPGLSISRARALAGDVETMARSGNCEACDAALERLKPLSAVHEFPSRVKCVTLPWRALIAALDGGKEATSE